MDCKKEIFVDGISKIHFAGGMVRIDFVTLQPQEGGTTETQIVQRVIVPPPGFLNMFSSMQQLIDKLVEAGVFQKKEKTSFTGVPGAPLAGALQKKEKTE